MNPALLAGCVRRSGLPATRPVALVSSMDACADEGQTAAGTPSGRASRAPSPCTPTARALMASTRRKVSRARLGTVSAAAFHAPLDGPVSSVQPSGDRLSLGEQHEVPDVMTACAQPPDGVAQVLLLHDRHRDAAERPVDP